MGVDEGFDMDFVLKKWIIASQKGIMALLERLWLNCEGREFNYRLGGRGMDGQDARMDEGL